MTDHNNSTERNGTLEPKDSRNVTGQSGGIGSPGGSDVAAGGERWGGGQQSRSQAQQGESLASSGQQEQSEDSGNDRLGDIREHMEVIGADGVHLGTVDKVEEHNGSWRIKLTKGDSPSGHQDHHHYISRGLVAEVEGDKVRLSATAANAYAMEEEE